MRTTVGFPEHASARVCKGQRHDRSFLHLRRRVGREQASLGTVTAAFDCNQRRSLVGHRRVQPDSENPSLDSHIYYQQRTKEREETLTKAKAKKPTVTGPPPHPSTTEGEKGEEEKKKAKDSNSSSKKSKESLRRSCNTSCQESCKCILIELLPY